MASVNKVILVGTLGKDPETRFMPDGGAVANMSLATNSKWKDKNTGEQREEVEWHRIVIYGRLAEVAGEYCKKGGSVYIEGRLKTRKWQDQSGVDKYTTEIIADQMQLLGGKRDQQGGSGDGGFSQDNQPRQQSQQRAPAQQGGMPPRGAPPAGQPTRTMQQPNQADLDDDIPF